MRHASTHTYAVLRVSQAAYAEVVEKLSATGYEGQFHEDGLIDMHGIALQAEESNAAGDRLPGGPMTAPDRAEALMERAYGKSWNDNIHCVRLYAWAINAIDAAVAEERERLEKIEEVPEQPEGWNASAGFAPRNAP